MTHPVPYSPQVLPIKSPPESLLILPARDRSPSLASPHQRQSSLLSLGACSHGCCHGSYPGETKSSSHGFHPMVFIQWSSSNGFHPMVRELRKRPWLARVTFPPLMALQPAMPSLLEPLAFRGSHETGLYNGSLKFDHKQQPSCRHSYPLLAWLWPTDPQQGISTHVKERQRCQLSCSRTQYTLVQCGE